MESCRVCLDSQVLDYVFVVVWIALTISVIWLCSEEPCMNDEVD